MPSSLANHGDQHTTTTGRKQNETESPKSNDIIGTSRESIVVEEHPEKETLTKETNEEPKEMGKLWVDVVSDNTNLANGMVIKYVASKVVNGEIEIEI